MQIVRKEVNPLLSQFEITIEPGDYSEKYENNLKKYKNKAQIKGFRKGMIPLNTLKKMYGKSLLADTVYDVLNDSFTQYLSEQKVNTLGSPLPTEGKDTELDFDNFNYKPFTFHFDVAIIPEYEVAGISESDVYDFDDVIIEEKSIEDNVRDFAKRNGKQEDVDGNIEENDILEIHAAELNTDLTPKEDGWKTEFSILVSSVKDEGVKAALLGKDKGFSFTFDITTLENPDQAYIDKYLLNRSEADQDVEIGNQFQGTVNAIKRQVPAILNEEFFTNLGDEKLKNEADLREVIRQELKDSYDKNARSLLERKIFDKIKNESTLEISRDFYRRLIEMNEKNNATEWTEEDLDKSLESTKWQIIKDDLLIKHGVTATEGEIKNHFFNQVMSYFRYYPNMDYNIVFDFVEKQMKNKNAVDKASEEIKISKLFATLTDTVSKNLVSIQSSDFLKKLESLDKPE